MKQMKLFLVALLTVVMGMSVTSCMNGEENTARQFFTVGQCVNSFPSTFQSLSGQKLIFNDASLITLETGKLYSFWYEYDSAEQPDNSATLNVTLPAGTTPTLVSAKYSEGPINKTDASEANSALRLFSLDDSTKPAVIFDQKYILIPIVYWVKVESTEEAQKKEFEKHSFILTYDADEIVSGATEMVMTLNHVVNTEGEENVKRDKYTSLYKAYDLTTAMYAFQAKAGNKPVKITIKAKVNASENSLKGATDAQWDYTIK